MFRNISFHKICKCGCLLDEKVCNNLQKWNKDKCRCQCLKIKKCKTGYSWNVSNFRCVLKKMRDACRKFDSLIESDKCDIETDRITEYKEFPKNKTVKIKNCKPFISVSILFLCVSIILTGIIIYFYLKSRNNNVLPC